jgi:small subunit ribosomal protein S1
MVHLSDLDWNRSGDEAVQDYKKGDIVKAVVLEVDPEKERISLGIKQLSDDPYDSVSDFKRGQRVTCEVIEVNDGGIEVKVADSDVTAFIKRSDLSRDRSEQRPERFQVGDNIDAAIMQNDRSGRRMNLSIKALEIAEEKEAVKQYGSTDSGASLGDILGAALGKSDDEEGENNS